MLGLSGGKFAAVLAVAVSALGVLCGLRTFALDMSFSQLQAEVGFWPRETYKPSALTRRQTDAALEALVEASPRNPDYQALRANQQAWESYWAEDGAARLSHANNALAAQWRALEARPAHRHSWEKLIQYSARGERGAEYRARAETQLETLVSAASAP